MGPRIPWAYVEVCAMWETIKTVSETLFFALPGIVAFLMAALALAVIYMDELQVKLKDQRAIRWIVSVVLIAMGIGAFVSDRVQKNEELRMASEKIRETAVETANDLSPKVAAETASRVTERLNKDYGDLIGGLYKQIASLQQNQVGLSQKQLALNYAPSVDLLYAGGQLQVWNRGRTNISLCGNKLDGERSDFAAEPAVITPTTGYYLLATALEANIHKSLGENGDTKVPLDLYLKSADGKKYIMHTTLLETVKDGQITINTQNHGYEEKDWSTLH